MSVDVFGRSEVPRHAEPVFGWDPFDKASVVIVTAHLVGAVVFFLTR